MKRLIFFQLILSLIFLGCSSDDQPKDSSERTIDAKVVKAGGGPCAFLIQPLGDSEVFLLDDIPEMYRVDNLPVQLTYRSKNSVFSCSGFLDAEEIEIVHIKNINSVP